MDILTEQQAAEESLFSHLKYNVEAAAGLTLEPQHFSSQGRAQIFAVLQQLARKGLPFDRRVINEHLQRRKVELDDQWWSVFDRAVPDGENRGDIKTIDHYGYLLRDYTVRLDYQEWLEQQLASPIDLRTDFRKVIQSHVGKLSGFQDSMTSEVDPSVEAIYNRSLVVDPNPYFPSGLAAIDRNVKGLRAGHIWAISAPYKGRKTSVALNVVAEQLRNDKAVMIVALEDDDQAFLAKLVAIWGKIPEDEVNARASGGEESERVRLAREEISRTKLRIYDGRRGVHNWKMLPTLIQSDRMRFGQLDVVVIDYLQEFSLDYEALKQIVPLLRRTCSEQQVCMLVLSQMNNADLRNQRMNSPSGQAGVLATKGTGDVGAACHVGIEIARDLMIPGELMLNVKVVRNGRPQQTFALIDEASGRITNNATKAALLVTWDENEDPLPI